MSYTVHQAKTNLSRLIKEAEEGKEVIITRGKLPVAKLVAIDQAQTDGIGGKSSSTPADPDELSDEELQDLGL